jgi:hypothetical protein
MAYGAINSAAGWAGYGAPRPGQERQCSRSGVEKKGSSVMQAPAGQMAPKCLKLCCTRKIQRTTV